MYIAHANKENYFLMYIAHANKEDLHILFSDGYCSKLRRLGPTNQIVKDSDFKPSELER